MEPLLLKLIKSTTLLATREAEAGSTMVEKDLCASLEVEFEVEECFEPSGSRRLLPEDSVSVRTTDGNA